MEEYITKKYRIIKRDRDTFEPQYKGLLWWKAFTEFQYMGGSFNKSFKTLDEAKKHIYEHHSKYHAEKYPKVETTITIKMKK